MHFKNYLFIKIFIIILLNLTTNKLNAQSLNLDKGVGCNITITEKGKTNALVKSYKKLVIIRKTSNEPAYYYYEEGKFKCIEIVNEKLDINLYSEFIHQVIKRFNDNDINISNCKNDCSGIEKNQALDENKRLFYQCGEDLNQLKKSIMYDSYTINMNKIKEEYDKVSGLIKSVNCVRQNGKIITTQDVVNKIRKQSTEANDMDVRSRSRATY